MLDLRLATQIMFEEKNFIFYLFLAILREFGGQMEPSWTGIPCFLVFPLLPQSSACPCQRFYWTVLQRLGVSDAISS